MFDKKIFSERLFHLRTSRNLTQTQLGNAINVSYFTIGKIEKAERAASIEVIYALADYFDVSLDYLVGRSDVPERR